MPLAGTISEQKEAPAEVPTQKVVFRPATAPPVVEKVWDGGRGVEPGQAAEEEAPKLDAMRMAITSRQVAEARRERAAAKAEREAAKAEREALASERAKAEATSAAKLDAMRRDPAAYINEYGLDHYNAVSQIIAQGGYTPEQMAARQMQNTQALLQQQAERQAALEKTMNERLTAQERDSKAARAEEMKQAEQAAVQDFMGDIHDFVTNEPGFRLVAKAGPNAIEGIFREIDAHYARTGGREKMPIAVAAARVRDQLEQEAREILEDQEIAQRLGVGRGPPPRQAPRSLNNRMAPETQPRREMRPQTEDERREAVLRQIDAARRGR
jgi:hypothetical protein